MLLSPGHVLVSAMVFWPQADQAAVFQEVSELAHIFLLGAQQVNVEVLEDVYEDFVAVL